MQQGKLQLSDFNFHSVTSQLQFLRANFNFYGQKRGNFLLPGSFEECGPLYEEPGFDLKSIYTISSPATFVNGISPSRGANRDVSSWLSRLRAPKPSTEDAERLQLPGGLWTKCTGCAEIVYSRELLRNLMVCPKCDYHFRMNAEQRINILCDRHSFEEMDTALASTDPLQFKDSARYRERLKKAQKATGVMDALRSGRARMNGIPLMIGVFEFRFMGGSMGTVVGEKLTRIIEIACRDQLPVAIVSASGGARMQEGIYSLMQMAKVSAALVKLGNLRLPYISVLTDPTTGGVAASFAMLGDVIIAEPGALIGFAGPRVIEQTIRRKLPEGFQRSEFLLQHGMIDLIAPRHTLKDTIANVIGHLKPQ